MSLSQCHSAGVSSAAKPPSWLARLFGAGKEQDPDRAVPVGFATSRAEAELMAGFLRDNGIQAIVFGDDEGGLSPALASQRRVRVLVPAVHQAKAMKLLEELEEKG
jgi:hypothetical protein